MRIPIGLALAAWLAAAACGGVTDPQPTPPAGSDPPPGTGEPPPGVGDPGTPPPRDPPPGDPPPATAWPEADPRLRGPYATVRLNGVGPGGAFTLFRPSLPGPGGRKHPVITWGNGTGASPGTYATLLDRLASHGFVVVASNNPNVAGGSPPHMIQALEWVFAEHRDPASLLHGKLDLEKVGATGHSQGAYATTSAAANLSYKPVIRAIAPIQGGSPVAAYGGAALFLCGGLDTVTPCSGSLSAFNVMNTGAVAYANLKAATHTNWLAVQSTSSYTVAVTAWFRAHLMDDAQARAYFYGVCHACGDPAWEIRRKNMP